MEIKDFITGLPIPEENIKRIFSQADLAAHTVTLDGRARLHIEQGRAR